MRQSKIILMAITMIALFTNMSVLRAEDTVRTITLYETHLRETTTVTFKRNGKFIPAGLKKLSYVLRDWRTGDQIRINPRLIDTIWELHKELGARGSVQIISGYRSPKTNKKLRRRGGGQAKRSQHMLGNAMDVRFTGVSTKRLREAAMKKERGGVGYYPSSRFVHVDVARVRAWPRMSRYQLAMLFPYKTTRHRPASGGPLTRRDRYKAQIRLAKLGKTRGGHQHGNTFLAQGGASHSHSHAKKSYNVAMDNSRKMVQPKSKLWVNAGNNQRFASLDVKTLRARQASAKGQAKVQKAKNNFDRSVGLKAKITDILSEYAKGDRTIQSGQKVAALTEDEANMDEFQAQNVGYAPIYNDEDPEEVAYQPFAISPIISGQHTAQLQEPAYNKLDLVDTNMIYSASFKSLRTMASSNWSSEFKGRAVRNLIGHQRSAANEAADKDMRVASR